MKTIILFLFIGFITINSYSQAIIANHTKAKLDPIPESAILQAKENLHIAYGHTSHGSQLITGMTGLVGKTNLVGYKGNIYNWNEGGTDGALDIDDNAFSSFGAEDLGNPNRTAWVTATRNYLAQNTDVNVVIWSWCGQASTATEANITSYLNSMNELETDFPNIKFVYMTGHLDGSGTTGNLHLRNQQIRAYCINNNKILYDFADIESYDPDGNYFLDKLVDDACDYDSDGNGSRDKNWARDWQTSHTQNTDWYSCSSQHSVALNANLKAYAAWWLWARLAGWNGGGTASVADVSDKNQILNATNYPNPTSVSTKLIFELPEQSNVSIKLFNQLGAEIQNIDLEKRPKGSNEYVLNTSNLTNGLYYYKICSDKLEITRKLIKQ